MSIDPLNEETITLVDVAKRLGKRRSTIHQWRKTGVRKVKLVCARIGNEYVTTAFELRRFIESTQNPSDGDDGAGAADLSDGPDANDSGGVAAVLETEGY